MPIKQEKLMLPSHWSIGMKPTKNGFLVSAEESNTRLCPMQALMPIATELNLFKKNGNARFSWKISTKVTVVSFSPHLFAIVVFFLSYFGQRSQLPSLVPSRFFYSTTFLWSWLFCSIKTSTLVLLILFHLSRHSTSQTQSTPLSQNQETMGFGEKAS